MKNTVKKCLACLLALLLVPVVLLVWGFALPAQYDDSFLGELKYKCERLQTAQGSRLVVLGGSAVAFGVDSSLLAQQLPAYTPVNFGMYAALGTEVMLELAATDLRGGDVVILCPEQQEQTLRRYCNGAATWQALDGAFYLLPRLLPAHGGALLGAYPAFAAAKLGYWQTGEKPKLAGVYRRASFDKNGDIAADCPQNAMPGGWDENTPILFEDGVAEPEFLQTMNEWAAKMAQKGVTVYYHFPPMNALAVAGDADAYFDFLSATLDFPILGDPNNSILDAGWFYDTNFHLNTAGKTVFTRQLVRDLKAEWQDTTPTQIALPEMPKPESPLLTVADNSDADCFAYTVENGAATLTGLTAEGKNRQSITVPGEIDGYRVEKLAKNSFAGATRLISVTLQSNIRAIADGTFSGCTALRRLHLMNPDPASCLVGQELLSGADFAILVPTDALDRYKLDYNWSAYALRMDTA